MIIRRIGKDDFSEIQKELANNFLPNEEVIVSVSKIVRDVRTLGDEAVAKYTKDFDGFTPDTSRVPLEVRNKAYKEATNDFKRILESAKFNIERFHKKQVVTDWEVTPERGQRMGQLVRPLESVALYVPGGKAAYPSSVLMNAIPAQLAGVKRIVIVTPAGPDGTVNPSVLTAATLLGIDEIYRIGGAQAIAAVAYGTESIPPVDKIVGPGNMYVAEAKRQVYGQVDIDMIAGPSEVLVIADDSANPQWIAADLLAQGEHDEAAGMILVTTSEKIASKVSAELVRQANVLSRSEILKTSLRGVKAYVVDSIDTGVELSNLIAPEHLELQVSDPFTYLDKVQNAGSIFLGAYTPETLGDYLAGPNHTLPTSGAARYASPLGVYDFIKRPSYLSFTQEALRDLARDLEYFANEEGLTAHANAVTVRCRP